MYTVICGLVVKLNKLACESHVTE